MILDESKHKNYTLKMNFLLFTRLACTFWIGIRSGHFPNVEIRFRLMPDVSLSPK